MSALVTVVLTSHLISSPAPIPAALWRKLRDGGADLSAVDSVLDWARAYLPEPEFLLVEARLAEIDEAAAELEKLAQDGIWAMTESDEQYPALWTSRLPGRCPPVLFVAGNASLLNQPSIGVVGSRDVDEAGAGFAAAIVDESSRLGYATVSGGARGVDQIAMRQALENDAGSIGILADSMQKTARGSHEALEAGSVCLVTPFSPYAPFQVGNAMGRNKLIYALSEATVVISADANSGGTWAGAVEALEMRLCPVLVRSDDRVPPGNELLIRRGGAPIDAASELGALLAGAPMPQPSLFG